MAGWTMAGLVAVSDGPAIGWADHWALALFGGVAILVMLWIACEPICVAAVRYGDGANSEVWTTNPASAQ
jgi:hypothetical protein